MVKKVVDVYNRAFEINAADEVSVDSETNNNSDIEASDAIDNDDDDEANIDTSVVAKPFMTQNKSTVTTTTDTICIESSNDTSLQDDVQDMQSSASSPVAVPKRDKRKVRPTNSSNVDNINPDDSLLQSIFKLLPPRNNSQEESEKSLLIGVGLGLGAAIANNTSNIIPDSKMLRPSGVGGGVTTATTARVRASSR